MAGLQDYANPLTRFAMSDYPCDGGTGMSQAHHGEKMLIDLPSKCATPTVRVDGKIYYTGELLQQTSGRYFIPERFFLRKQVGETAGDRSEELHALGWEVDRSQVCTRIRCLLISDHLTYNRPGFEWIRQGSSQK
jgi:hypothetical protein